MRAHFVAALFLAMTFVPIGSADVTCGDTGVAIDATDLCVPDAIGSKAPCASSPAIGTVTFSAVLPIISMPAQQQEGGGDMGFETDSTGSLVAHSNLQGVGVPSVGLFMAGIVDGFFASGVGTIQGVPIAVHGTVNVQCGKVSVDTCFEGVCLKVGTKIACTADATGPLVIGGVGATWTSSSSSVYPCS